MKTGHDKKKALTIPLIFLLLISNFVVLAFGFEAGSILVVDGTYTSGNLASIQTKFDNDYYVVTEAVGVPGFDIRINFTDVINPFQSVTWREQYTGGAGHIVQLDLWNYTAGAWVNYMNTSDSFFFHENTGLVYDYQHHVEGDIVQARIFHSANGNINHVFSLDYLALTNSTGWLTDWNTRIELTLDSDDVDESLIDFPVLLHLSDSSGISSTDVTAIFDAVENDYNATAYTMGDGLTRLYFEMDTWNATAKEANIWISPYYVSNLTDTILYIYYDNSQNGTEYNVPANVWDQNFVMVQHMNDNSTTTILDSTLNNIDGTKTGANQPIEDEGIIGSGQNFSSGNYGINAGDVLDVNASESVTVEGWIKTNDYTAINFLVCKGGIDGAIAVGNEGYGLRITGNRFRAQAKDSDESLTDIDTVNAVNDVWFYVVTRVNRVTNELSLFKNGVIDVSPVGTATLGDMTNAKNLKIGAYATNDAYGSVDGVLDEIRITIGVGNEGVRSESWILVNYETQTDDFVYYSAPMKDYSIDDVLGLGVLALVLALVALCLVVIWYKK